MCRCKKISPTDTLFVKRDQFLIWGETHTRLAFSSPGAVDSHPFPSSVLPLGPNYIELQAANYIDAVV
jgi:hypothetical protein